MAWIRHDIFLSYSHSDKASSALFVAALREKGYRVFYDVQSIAIGDPWKVRLSQAIRASRVVVLCWSERARTSDVVAFEYSRAEALGKPVLPWLLDGTPLPQMIEIQGVIEQDPAKAASQLVPYLGLKLSLRRRAQALCLFLLLVAAGWVYWRTHLPWEFKGQVTDSETRLPLAGVRVDAEWGRYVAHTDEGGRYVLVLPRPKPERLHLVFSKEGYTGVAPVDVKSDHWDTDMTRLK